MLLPSSKEAPDPWDKAEPTALSITTGFPLQGGRFSKQRRVLQTSVVGRGRELYYWECAVRSLGLGGSQEKREGSGWSASELTACYTPRQTHKTEITSQRYICSQPWRNTHGTWTAAWRHNPSECRLPLQGSWLRSQAAGDWPRDNRPRTAQ